VKPSTAPPGSVEEALDERRLPDAGGARESHDDRRVLTVRQRLPERF
jgi:hypothetical protein